MRTKPLSEVTKTICDNLNICIKTKGVTQAELAEVINSNQQAISRFLLGLCIPKPEQMTMLCDYFDISIDQLYGRQELLVLDNDENAIYNFIISHDEILNKIKKSLDDIDLTTDLKSYIKKKIKTDSEFKNYILNKMYK